MVTKKNKIFLSFFIIFSFASILSCQNSSNTKLKNTLKIGLERYPDDFDPRTSSDAISQKINKLLYRGLLKLDQNLQLVPDLAQSYKIENETTYKVTLKKGLTFTNGKVFSTKDVLATYNAIRNGVVRSHYKSNLKWISKIQIHNDYEMTFIYR